MRNHLPDVGALLCLMGHLHRSSGDSKRAVDTYIEALKVNPYLWEAFDGLIELGMSLSLFLSLMCQVSRFVWKIVSKPILQCEPSVKRHIQRILTFRHLNQIP